MKESGLEKMEREDSFEKSFAERDTFILNGAAATETVLSQLDTKYDVRKKKITQTDTSGE